MCTSSSVRTIFRNPLHGLSGITAVATAQKPRQALGRDSAMQSGRAHTGRYKAQHGFANRRPLCDEMNGEITHTGYIAPRKDQKRFRNSNWHQMCSSLIRQQCQRRQLIIDCFKTDSSDQRLILKSFTSSALGISYEKKTAHEKVKTCRHRSRRNFRQLPRGPLRTLERRRGSPAAAAARGAQPPRSLRQSVTETTV